MKPSSSAGFRMLLMVVVVLAFGSLAAFTNLNSTVAKPVEATEIPRAFIDDPGSQASFLDAGASTPWRDSLQIPVTGIQASALDAGASSPWKNSLQIPVTGGQVGSLDAGASAPWNNTSSRSGQNRNVVTDENHTDSRSSGGGR